MGNKRRKCCGLLFPAGVFLSRIAMKGTRGAMGVTVSFYDLIVVVSFYELEAFI